ncbi:MAG: MbnP family copper-binding protein [Myxococcota bacterium]
MRTTLFLASLLAVAGCGEDGADTTVALQFALYDGADEIECDDVIAGAGADAVDLQLRDARFYVSNVRLVTAGGAEVPMAIDQVSPFQTPDLALLDFEASCSEAGDAETNHTVVGTVPAGEYTGLRFTVGVPFELNHLDQASMDPLPPEPLRPTGMWWNWQGGFKFMRIDFAPTPDSTSPGFNIHLGSTACMGNPSMGEDVTSCGNPNRMEVELTGFDAATDKVAFDLRAALDGALTNQNTGAALGCQSFPMDDECPAIFDNLGLPYAGVAPSGPQTVFGVR